MVRRSFRRDCKGQVIVITALLVALILLSTAMYVIEIQKATPIARSNDGVPIDSYRNSVKSTLISALANVSGGGDESALVSNLAVLKSVILVQSYESQLSLDFDVLDGDGYSGGLRIERGDNGIGISSAYVSVSCSSKNSLASSEVSYAVNVTSSMLVSGYHTQLNDTYKEVALTINLLSESGPALADRFTIYYQGSTGLSTVDSPGIVNFGNGTYTATFSALSSQIDGSIEVSVDCLDTRGITIGTRLMCYRKA